MANEKSKPANNIREGPRARWRPLRNKALLALTGGQVTNDQLRIMKAHDQHKKDWYRKALRRSKRLNRINEGRELQREALKTNILHGLAGPLLFALSDKYLSPLARKAGTKLGESVLVPLGRKIDKRLARKK